MKTLLLFAIESPGQPFDEGILSMLEEEQAKHRALYRTDLVRVLLGSENDLDPTGLTWQVRMNDSGAPDDPEDADVCAARLTTELFSRMAGSPDGCELALIGAGDARTELAALHLGKLLTKRLLLLTAVNTHLILLQDQKVYQDAPTGRLMDAILQLNSQTPPFYSTLYMLPWEASNRQKTRWTVSTLVKVMIMGGGHALGHATMLRGSQWIETAAVTRLKPPVQQINMKVFDFLAGDFNERVLTPALESEGEIDTRTNDLQSGVHEIVNTLLELERKNGLPSLNELYMIMPERNPSVMLSAKDAPTPAKAWEHIYSIYGETTGRDLYHRMYPDMDTLAAGYDAQRPAITVLLLNKVLEIGAKRAARGADCGFEQLPVMIDSIKLQVLKRLENRSSGEVERQKYAFSLMPRQSKAVNIARTRHILLDTVYENAQQLFGAKRAELRSKMFRSAADMAKSYLSDCMIALKSEFDQMCSIRAARIGQMDYFSYRMDDAYDAWCRHKMNERVGLADLYECFTEAVCRMPYDEAAQNVCDQLEALLDARTRAATDMIKVHLGNFFAELKFRDGLLRGIDGRSDDLNAKLLDHLQSQLPPPPLMCYTSTEQPLRAISKMFIIHRSGNSDEFAGRVAAGRDGTGILNDPYEDGVQMIVKYAGNALEDLVVYKNNPPEA